MIPITFLATLAPIATLSAPAAPAAFDDIAADVRAKCDRGEFSGVITVARANRELLRVACAAPGTPRISNDTRFKFFSMSKIFTGMALTRLIERGKVDPEGSIAQYVSKVPDAWRAVTVRELLTHTSGIPDLTERLLAEFDAGAANHHAAMVRLLGNLQAENPPLSFPPDTKWRYNNFGYELLAEIGAAAAKKPFDQVLRELVLEPAGMKNAVVALPLLAEGKPVGSKPVARLVPGFNGKPGALEPAESKSYVQLGAGAVIGTESDLRAYDMAMRSGTLLSLALQASDAAQAFRVNDRVAYGNGAMYRKSGDCTVVQHSGGSNGYVSDFARIPERRATVIVLSNLGFATADELRSKLVNRLTEAEPCS